MITCLIIDDEQHAIDLLTSYVGKVPGLTLSIATTNPIEAFQHIQINSIDLVYLDIHMPDLDGIQFLKLLAGKSKVILTTAYPEHALEGYEHDIIDYLLKPIMFDRFLKATQKAINLFSNDSNEPMKTLNEDTIDDYIFVKSEIRNKIIKIKLNEVLYIESMGNYVSFYIKDIKIITLTTMKELDTQLSNNSFFRVHKSYIVSIDKIDAVEGNQILIGKNSIPLGETYKEDFFKRIGDKIFNSKK
jgi:DNA-binding LytR/AlgR family response regulator